MTTPAIPVRPPLIQSPAFRAWFTGSCVVDTQGGPLVVYHGTAAEFTAFNPSLGVGRGSWFSNSRQGAELFASTAFGGRVIAVHLAIRNPLTGHTNDRAGRGPSYWANRARRSSHDGLILTSDDYGPGEVAYVVFHPSQIKSATSNAGTFDRTNPDFCL